MKINKVPEEQWDQLLQKGLENDTSRYFNRSRYSDQIATLEDFDSLYAHLQRSMQEFVETGLDPFFSKSYTLNSNELLKRFCMTLR